MILFRWNIPAVVCRLLRRKYSIIEIALVLCLVVLAWGSGSDLPDTQAVKSDARAYATLAVNLWRHGVFSSDEADTVSPMPTQYREPAYPAFLALVIATHRELRNKPMENFLSAGKDIRSLKRSGLLLFVLLPVLIYVLVRKAGGSRAAALSAGLLVIMDRGSQNLLATTLSEHLTMVAMAAVSLSLMGLVRRPGTGCAALGGLALAVLVLTKTVFQLFLPVALLWVWWNGRGLTVSRRWIAVAVFAGAFALPVGAWKLRNVAHFGNASLVSGRSGVVLMARALSDTMTPEERRAAWIYWMPEGKLRNRCARSAFGNRFEEATRRLDRRCPESFYRRARIERQTLLEEMGAGPRVHHEMDRRLTRYALNIIQQHAGAHLALTPAFAWRCLFSTRGLRLLWPFTWKWEAPLRWTMLWAGGLLIGTVMSFLRRDICVLALTLPSLFLLGSHAFLTHCVPRYGLGMVPFGIGALALVGDATTRRLAKRYKRWKDQNPLRREIREETHHPDSLPE